MNWVFLSLKKSWIWKKHSKLYKQGLQEGRLLLLKYAITLSGLVLGILVGLDHMRNLRWVLCLFIDREWREKFANLGKFLHVKWWRKLGGVISRERLWTMKEYRKKIGQLKVLVSFSWRERGIVEVSVIKDSIAISLRQGSKYVTKYRKHAADSCNTCGLLMTWLFAAPQDLKMAVE